MEHYDNLLSGRGSNTQLFDLEVDTLLLMWGSASFYAFVIILGNISVSRSTNILAIEGTLSIIVTGTI